MNNKPSRKMICVMLGVVVICFICIICKSLPSGRDENVEEVHTEKSAIAHESTDTEMEYVKENILNLQSGFYEVGTELVLTVQEGMTVYYTLDGSLPSAGEDNTFCLEKSTTIALKDTSGNPNVYSARTDSSVAYEEYMHYAKLERAVFAVPDELVDKCNVVRAISVDSAGNITASQTEVYFVGFMEKQGYESLKTVALVVEPEDFWGYDKGINVLGRTFDEADKEALFAAYGQAYSLYSANYRNTGAEWEREAKIFIFNEEQRLLEEKNVGMRVKGNGSRGVAQKSFNLYARKRYDDNNAFSGELFDAGVECKTITLFNGGPFSQDKLKDILASEFAKGLNFATLEYTPCNLFINGEYWGMYYISERIDNVYLHNKFRIDKDNVVVVKNRAVQEGVPEDINTYWDIVDFIANNDMSLEENFECACQLIDMESVIDYYAYEIYINNADWPSNNVALWKVREISEEKYCDGLWRYILFDVDASLGYPDSDDLAMAIDRDEMFRSLLGNKRFREKLFARLQDIGNICFENSIVQQYIKEYQLLRKGDVTKSMRRWYRDDSVNNFLIATTDISNFFKERLENIQKVILNFYIQSYSTEDSEMDEVTGGITYVFVTTECFDEDVRLSLNGLEIKSRDEIWVGKYLGGTKLEFDISVGEGANFAGWRINEAEELVCDNHYSFTLEETTYLEAVFE